MLSAFRRFAGTWVAKVLFLLLVLSFGIWGIEDVVRNFGASPTAVARVGGEEIDLVTAQQAARREMARVQRQLGPNFQQTPEIRQSVAQQAVAALVNSRVMEQEAQSLDVVAPREAVRRYVFAIPAFQAGGQFDRRIFNQFLQGNGLDEPTFLRFVEEELKRQQLAAAVRAGAFAPDALARQLVALAGEQRTVQLVRLRLNDAPEPAAPTEEELRRFHENNPAEFSTPETRTATVARLAAEIVVPEVQVSDAEIQAAYDAAGTRFRKPEQRQLEQVLIADESKARELAESWKNGASFADIAKQAQAAGGQALELGSLDRGGMPVPELAEAAFSAPEGGVTAPIKSAFGWHVLRVVKIEPASTQSLDEVRDQLRTEVAQTKAADLAYQRINDAQDALAGGTKLADVARQAGMRVDTVTTDSTGHDADGKEVALPVPDYARQEALAAIFAASAGQPGRIDESKSGAGFLGIELQSVQPPKLRPFEQVRDAVRAAWVQDARAHAQEVRATALMTATEGGKTLAAAATEAGLGSEQIGPVGRGPGTILPPEMLAPVFATKLNAATMARTADGFAVAQVLSVQPGDTEAPNALAGTRSEVETAMQDELEQSYLDALRRRAKVEVNEGLMAQVAGQ
ncbi:SurA N-terminal domain-containing protein [Roseomonas elaeocarpi]|uniref:Parvulin-like PPIase n=1 Tax=Roseomonas elaeocarpi TaxID=907779 RepID=A0ABV6JXE6_9PROT